MLKCHEILNEAQEFPPGLMVERTAKCLVGEGNGRTMTQQDRRSKTTASSGCHTPWVIQTVQPFPESGLLADNSNLPLAILADRIRKVRGSCVLLRRQHRESEPERCWFSSSTARPRTFRATFSRSARASTKCDHAFLLINGRTMFGSQDSQAELPGLAIRRYWSPIRIGRSCGKSR